MAIITKADAGLVRIGVAGEAERIFIVVETGTAAKTVCKTAVMGFWIGALDPVKVGVAEQAGGIVSLGVVASSTRFDVSLR